MMDEPLFFSIVIPAHNEEAYVGRLLTSVGQLDYPHDRMEVIVVQNGSTDRTAAVVAQAALPWFTVETLAEPGVSKAKNRGIELLAEASDWVIFLDADTSLGPTFLHELDRFLRAHADRNLGHGMVSLLPYPDSRLARGWYHFYNVANRLTRTTRSIQVIRRDLLRDIRFDETLAFGEDTKMLAACSRRSRYFYMDTRSVFSSTRRFEEYGWMRQLFIWIYLTMLPYRTKQRMKYPAVR